MEKTCAGFCPSSGVINDFWTQGNKWVSFELAEQIQKS